MRGRLPGTLRGVLTVRLSLPSEEAGRLIEMAAVAGRSVDHQLLADVCALSADALRTALREAVEAQILVVEHDRTFERYRFRHALVQEAAYDDLLPAERRGLHVAYAHAIEARPAGVGATRPPDWSSLPTTGPLPSILRARSVRPSRPGTRPGTSTPTPWQWTVRARHWTVGRRACLGSTYGP